MFRSKSEAVNIIKKSQNLKIFQRSYCKIKNETLTPVQKSQKLSKEDMEWRTPWSEKQGHWYSLLKTFSSDHNQTAIVKWIQTPIDLQPSSIKKWWLKKKEKAAIADQTYLPERQEMLGNELAAAHFIVHRGGSVKFYGEEEWIKRDDLGNYKLPTNFLSDKVIQCIDCTDMTLYYEGLSNFRGLKQMEWLSLNNSHHIDDWCLDRISNIFKYTLLHLDLRNCKLITERGLGSLYKMEALKTLLIDNPTISKEIEMTCLLLQENKSDLDIKIT